MKYGDVVNTVFDNYFMKIKSIIEGIGIPVVINKKHILDRLKTRDIDILYLHEVMKFLYDDRLCTLLYYFSLPLKTRPFTVYVKTEGIILVLSRSDDTWKFNTVLDPKKHNKHPNKSSSFYAYIE